MSRVSDVVTSVAQAAFGAMWLFAAGAKLASPLAVYELTAHVAPPGAASKALVAAAIAGETLLGAAMVLRVVRGFGLSIAGLAALTGVLLAVRAAAGELVPCGCLGDALAPTLDGAILRNAVLASILAALMVWRRLGRTADTIPPCPS
jgi:hypothetical protein